MPSLLFLPDISGFTKFVNETEVSHGRHIVAELLELIIDSDCLGMTVSELEGDAVFFIRRPASSFDEILEQARITFHAFHTHLKGYETRRICDCGACRTAHQLSIKMVAHAGPIETISVHGFEKPYGPDVILAHRLLKNDVPESEYLLVTDGITGPSDGSDSGIDSIRLPEWASLIEQTTEYEDYGAVPYRYIPLGPLSASIPDPPPLVRPERSDNPITLGTHISRPTAEVFGLLSEFDSRRLWTKGLDEIRFEEDRVNRVGTKHQCVIDGATFEFETTTNDFGEGRLAYGERILNSPFVDEAASYYILEEEDGGTRLSVEVHYKPRPFPQSLLAPVFRFGFRRKLLGIVESLKAAAEGRSIR
jgi:hypothetical protein